MFQNSYEKPKTGKVGYYREKNFNYFSKGLNFSALFIGLSTS